MTISVDDDDVYEDSLVAELVDMLRERHYDDAVEWVESLDEHDGYVPLGAVIGAAAAGGIPIPAHFEPDVAYLVSTQEMERRDLDELREIMADQRARGLIAD